MSRWSELNSIAMYGFTEASRLHVIESTEESKSRGPSKSFVILATILLLEQTIKNVVDSQCIAESVEREYDLYDDNK